MSSLPPSFRAAEMDSADVLPPAIREALLSGRQARQAALLEARLDTLLLHAQPDGATAAPLAALHATAAQVAARFDGVAAGRELAPEALPPMLRGERACVLHLVPRPRRGRPCEDGVWWDYSCYVLTPTGAIRELSVGVPGPADQPPFPDVLRCLTAAPWLVGTVEARAITLPTDATEPAVGCFPLEELHARLRYLEQQRRMPRARTTPRT